MLAVLLAGTLGIAPSPQPPAPLPELTTKCERPSDGAPRLTLTLRNVHDSPMLLWAVRTREPGEMGWGLRRSDNVAPPNGLRVEPGQVVVEETSWSCVSVTTVVAAQYDDGTLAGERDAWNEITSDREASAVGLAELLDALRPPEVAADGFADKAAFERFLEGVRLTDRARARSAAFSAVSPHWSTAYTAPDAPKEVVVERLRQCLDRLTDAIAQARRRW